MQERGIISLGNGKGWTESMDYFLVYTCSPMWCSWEVHPIIKGSYNWHGMQQNNWHRSQAWQKMIILVLTQPWIKVAFTVALLILSNRWYHVTQKLCFISFPSKLQQHDPHIYCFLRNVSVACIWSVQQALIVGNYRHSSGAPACWGAQSVEPTQRKACLKPWNQAWCLCLAEQTKRTVLPWKNKLHVPV